MQAPIAPAAASAITPPGQAPTAPTYTDNPCKRIKLEIPKFDRKDSESWIINFERYCRILKLKTDEDILLAMGIAMTGKATLWWHYMEPEVTTWQEAKEAVTSVYGDPRKKKDCANKLKCLAQGSMTISEFFVEVQNLNTHAQLDVETLPTFLEPGLNNDLRSSMEYMESLQPINTYKAWKERALQRGRYLKAAWKKDRKYIHNPSLEDGNTTPETPNQPDDPTTAAAKGTKPRATQSSVPQEEKDSRMAAGECLKCGKFGHIAKNCRTGWKYDLAVTPEIRPIERSKQRNRKRKWKEQADNSETD